jgi:uncharacterized protein with von Willebrand factor type A (vWA) domain
VSSSRYSRWDGTRDPFGDDFDLGEVLDEMSDDLLSGAGANQALRRLQQQGMRGRFGGLDALRQRIEEMRRRAMEDLNASGPLEGVREALDEIEEIERLELSTHDDEDSRFKEAMLDALPRNPAAEIRELTSYDFASSDARSRFEHLLEELRQEVLNSYFSNIAGALQSMGPDDLRRINDMLAELNDMISRRDRGEEYDFAGFMERHGHMFPDNPRSLDELLRGMAQRMAAMSSLLESMSPEQRAQLAELASAVLDDMDLAFQVDQLGRSLREMMPELAWDQEAPSWGEGNMPMSAAVDAIERMSDLDDLGSALTGDYPGASLEDVDEDRLRRILDEDAVHDLHRLKEIERALEEAGLLNRSRGRLKLTARGARLLGERSLTKLLERIRREPSHRARGGHAEPTGATRQWTFGDSDPLSVERTVYNAVTRAGPIPDSGTDSGRGVPLKAEDFEVTETESRPRTATALLLDLSFSMPLGGHWVPAKRMALALHALIEGKYPQDSLYLVGFSDYARQMNAADLAVAGWEHVHGTNMQHAFMLARRLLKDDPRAIKQVIMVTDGEPTAHLEGDYAMFNWPPVRETIDKTLREAVHLSRLDISINVFMLEETRGLVAFMDRLARLTGGRVFPAGAGDLGDAVVGDYVRRRAGGRRAS